MASFVHQIVFDVDGTLLDTEMETAHMTAALAAAHGCIVSPEEVFIKYSGFENTRKFAAIAEVCGVELAQETLEELSVLHEERKADIYEQASVSPIRHVPEILETLANEGYLMSIGSNNDSPRSQMALENAGLSAYFNGRFYGPDLVGFKWKPDPAIYSHAINDNGSLPENTVIVDDTVAGITAASRAGAKVIGYLDPRYRGEIEAKKIAAFREAGADIVVRCFREIPAQLPPPAPVASVKKPAIAP